MSDCPYCLSPIEQDVEAATCEACGAVHHRECWDENKGCCVRTCPRVSRTTEIDLPSKAGNEVVVTRESAEAAVPHKRERVGNPCMKCGKQVELGELYCPECEPGPPESEDTRNVGPLLVMLALLAVAIGWVIVCSLGGELFTK